MAPLSTLAQLGATGSLVALLPLAMVWIAADADKYRKLVWTTVLLTFDLIVFGAFTRLSDSGLGCPDWPGCYGLANPALASRQIDAAEALLPNGPVTVLKAWIEMTHRYLALAIGVLIVAMTAQAWRQWRASRRPAFSPWPPGALLALVCLQGAFGAWTVTLKLQPLIVTLHLLFGMTLLAALTWLGMRQNGAAADGADAGTRWLAALAGVLLAVQIALGGWVSANYAALACADFPLCGGQLLPAMDFGHGFTLWRALGRTGTGHALPFDALTAIHWAHRSFALLAIAAIACALWRAWRHAALRGTVRAIAAVLALQACSGVATILLHWPLAIAVLHNAGAALLVLLLVMLNYQARSPAPLARPVAAGAPVSP